MAPFLLALAGVVALGAAALIQRSFGGRARVGRLLAVAPKVSVAEAIRLAQSGETRYVRVDGRLDSDQEFEDEAHRPLVVRRTVLEWRPAKGNRTWTRFDTNLEVVPFAVREGLDAIVVDGQSLAEGLVVLPRERKGVAADLGAEAPAGVPADASVRLIVDQASTIEHAAVLGVPRRAADGHLEIGPGLGRPLVLTTLEDDEAMRVLTGGAAGRARLALACLVAGAGLLGLALVWVLVDQLLGGVATVLAASPEPTLRPGSDTRTTGGGPGLVGEPLLALLGVLAIALLSVVVSLAYVRLSGGPRRHQPEDPPRPW
ncbi:MAG TPA: hypothetical protein VL749_09525 [Patescibacteria group bacterium]|nr:hypothetical protein [Patescibacteria group bacterium]